METTWQQKMAGLATEKRHGPGRPHRTPHDSATRPIHAAWQIDRNDRNAAAVYCVDQRAWQAVHVASQASAKHRVHDDVAIGQSGRRRVFNRSRPTPGGQRGISFQPGSFACGKKTNQKATFGQMPRRHEPIAAVVAWACDDSDTLAPHVGNGIGYCAPGILHKLNAGDAPSDCQTVRFRHLGGREQLNHRANLPVHPETNNSN